MTNSERRKWTRERYRRQKMIQAGLKEGSFFRAMLAHKKVLKIHSSRDHVDR